MKTGGHKIMLSGGGTGGSVTPLLAFADYYAKENPGTVFVFVGNGELEEKLVADREGVRFVRIAAGKWRRYFSLLNFLDLFKIAFAFFQSIFIIAKERPALVMTAGSFISVPLAFAAKLSGVSVLVHQQDIRPGLANKLMAPLAKEITVVFEKSLDDYGQKAVLTGNPVEELAFNRDKEALISSLGLDSKRPLIMAFGGGTGAGAINELVSESLPHLLPECQVVLITGKGKTTGLESRYRESGYRELELVSHVRLLEIMNASKLVVSRAGLGALTDLAMLAKPAIVIPMPSSHQEDNAQAFADRESIIYLHQDKIGSGILASEILKLLSDTDMQERLSGNISKMINTDACADMAKVVDDNLLI